MKTKSVHKKGKKRSLREPSLSSKPDQKSEDMVELKKNRKKTKIDNTIENGNENPAPKTKVQVLQKKKRKKVKKNKKNDGNIDKLPKVKTTVAEEIKPIAAEPEEKALNEAKEKKLEHLKNKQLIREMNKIVSRKVLRYKAPATPLDLEKLRNKVAEMRNRETLGKTARKKIATLLRKIGVAEAERAKKSETVEKGDKRNKQQDNISAKNKQKADIKGKRKVKGEHGEKKRAEIDKEEDNENTKDDSDRDQSNVEEEEEEVDIAQEEIDADSPEDEEEDDKEMVIVEVKKKKIADQSSDVPKKRRKKEGTRKKRYVLFIGNLPHDVTSNELKQHFLSKVDAVTNVVLQTKPGTKKSRGFAYLELSNSADYEKALSLNHTFLKKKRINVQYAPCSPTNTNKVDVVAKNKKLEALRKTGKFADIKEKKKLSKEGKQIRSKA